MHGEAGKGDSPRPKSISDKEYTLNFEKAFGKKKPWWACKKHKKWMEQVEKDRIKDAK